MTTGWRALAHLVALEVWLLLVVTPSLSHVVVAVSVMVLGAALSGLVARTVVRLAVVLVVAVAPDRPAGRSSVRHEVDRRAPGSVLVRSGNGPRAPGRAFVAIA